MLALAGSFERRVLALLGSGGFGYLLEERVAGRRRLPGRCPAGRRRRLGDRSRVLRQLVASTRPTRCSSSRRASARFWPWWPQGRSNGGIARHLCVAEKTVEAHVSSILCKLGLGASADVHRRVLAALRYVHATAA